LKSLENWLSKWYLWFISKRRWELLLLGYSMWYCEKGERKEILKFCSFSLQGRSGQGRKRFYQFSIATAINYHKYSGLK
jgi:hypothetical protein